MLDLDKPFKLFSNCVIVKGAERSAICDLQNNDVRLIPNDLADLLSSFEGQSLRSICSSFDEESRETIEDYFRFLYEAELIFFTDSPGNFPAMEFEYEEPSLITHALIDIDSHSVHPFSVYFDKLEKLQCRFIQFRFFRPVLAGEISALLRELDERQSVLTSVEMTIPYAPHLSSGRVAELLEKNPRLTVLRIYSAPENTVIKPSNAQTGLVVYDTKNYSSCLGCGEIKKEYFAINVKTYSEGLRYNTCLNGKIAIDAKGALKNCPSSSTSFGLFSETDPERVIYSPAFTRLWSVTKDQVKTCKDCEFRRVCTDCRIYVEDPEDEYSKPLKCGYNPYDNTWEDWSTNPLKQATMAHYEKQSDPS